MTTTALDVLRYISGFTLMLGSAVALLAWPHAGIMFQVLCLYFVGTAIGGLWILTKKKKTSPAPPPAKRRMTLGDLRKAEYDMYSWEFFPLCFETPERLRQLHSKTVAARKLFEEKRGEKKIPSSCFPDHEPLPRSVHMLLREACKAWEDAGGLESYLDWKNTIE